MPLFQNVIVANVVGANCADGIFIINDLTGFFPGSATGYGVDAGASIFTSGLIELSDDNQATWSYTRPLAFPLEHPAPGGNTIPIYANQFSPALVLQNGISYCIRYSVTGNLPLIGTPVTYSKVVCFTFSCGNIIFLEPNWVCETIPDPFTGTTFTGWQIDTNNAQITAPTHRRWNPDACPLPPPVIPKTVECCDFTLSHVEEIRLDCYSKFLPAYDKLFKSLYRNELFGYKCTEINLIQDINYLAFLLNLLYNDALNDRTTNIEADWKTDEYWWEKYSLACIRKKFSCLGLNILPCIEEFLALPDGGFGHVESPEPIFTIT